MKKLIAVQTENKKLKEEIQIKNNVFNENEMLKKEIINLKNKVNELMNNKKYKEKNDEVSMGILDSVCSSIPGKNLATIERYIIKLEKENEELSNKILRYKNMLKFKINDNQ